MSTNNAMMGQIWAFASFIITTFCFCILMLFGGWFLGGRSHGRYKNIPFESGIKSVGDTHIKLSIKFYLVAMLFVIFDVEALFLYVWAVSVRENSWFGFTEAAIFITTILLSLIYIVRFGVLNIVPKHR
ncbi:NADH-quinone oxidoreductase subunit A [Candidatus Pantoea edessiphila]|uniref:NADH-quinone oxidoreductase subunit A n=1 Tax=Candidatus Pantoea edessiphila TaxID=2044610 RepID=A0A2P5SYI8_9GAMM|nr:NADH-quinone oxidoreductase subunit A [Candidatus Pantoea edessiphila]MBK4775477.1 NADH-quinone oxidoreductase subunit A [Pantoea sp. Edef]PPI87394.1 NADH-quinone oxidoreductase subunit A [Candidatus Pantoea edessiphila]